VQKTEGRVGMPEGAQIESPTSAGYVTFVGAGERAVGEYYCSECGYGVSVQQRLPRCPMCSGEMWEPAAGAGLQLQ
jgi:rubrerythrin